MPTPTSTSTESPGTPDRETILAMLGDTMQEVQTHIETTTAETPEEERLQIKWVRTLGYLSGHYRKLQAERDLDQMEADIELLQTATGLEEDDR